MLTFLFHANGRVGCWIRIVQCEGTPVLGAGPSELYGSDLKGPFHLVLQMERSWRSIKFSIFVKIRRGHSEVWTWKFKGVKSKLISIHKDIKNNSVTQLEILHGHHQSDLPKEWGLINRRVLPPRSYKPEGSGVPTKKDIEFH